MNMVKESIFKGIRNSNFNCDFIPNAFITQDGNCGVNVKNHTMRFHPIASENNLEATIYEWLEPSFWNKVQDIGRSFGYDHVEIEGRSGGWACPGYFYNDTQYGKKFYNIKPPALNNKTDMPLRDIITIERFNSFSFYVKQLHKMILVEMRKITTQEELMELVKEIMDL
jgi:hypothetical protein